MWRGGISEDPPGHCSLAATLELPLPIFSDQILAKAVVGVGFAHGKAMGGIDLARRREDRLGPQPHAPIAVFAGETDRLVDQHAANSKPAGLGFDVEHA